MSRQKIIIILLAVLTVVGFTAFLLLKNLQGLSPEQRYKTQVLGSGDITQIVSANGTLNPVVLVNVGTQVSGTVKKLGVDFNDKVRPGQILAELDPSLFQAQVNQDLANVSNAKATLDLTTANEARTRELLAKEYVTQQDMDTAVQALKSARAQLDLAEAQLQKDQINLNNTVIRSPVAGVVVARLVDVGQTVAASFQTPTLFSIAQDLRKMQIDSSYAEADVGNIKVGQAAQFTVDAYPNRTFKGLVSQIRLNPTIVQNVVTYDVVVSVDNPEQILLPGMTAYVNIIVAQRKNILMVPNAALRFKPSNLPQKPEKQKGKDEKRTAPSGTVYVLSQGELRQVTFTTGITDNRFTEVVSGELKAGDNVVVDEGQPSGGNGSSSSGFRFRMF